ncbi:hypothetical protein RSOL_365280, partial [Rhizoctonia solani AG-3 Rhs1AP]
MGRSRYIPESSRRVDGIRKPLQPQGLQSRKENVANSDDMNASAPSAEAEEYGSVSLSEPEPEPEPESELESEPEPEPSLESKSSQVHRQTATTFSSEEIDAMPCEDLVRNFKAFQQAIIGDKTEEESSDRTSTNQAQSSNNPAPVNLSEQERHLALVTHTRKSFCIITDMKDGSVVRAMNKDADGVIQYWTTNEHGIKILTPAWEAGFHVNWKVWGERFLNQCRAEEEMPDLARDYLKTVPDATFLKTLKDVAWKTYAACGRQAAQGTLEQSQAAKKQKNRQNNRIRTKAIQRARASQGTCVDSGLPEFEFLYRPRAQSLPVPDTSNSSQEVVRVPSFISDQALAIKQSLDLKAGSKSSKPLVYVKVDVPVTQLDSNHVWPEWAISETWKQSHSDEYNKSMHLIDPDRTVMPDVSALTNRYKAPLRTYLPAMPPGMELPDNHSHQSRTPAPVHEEGLEPPVNLPLPERPSSPVAPVSTEESQAGGERPLLPQPRPRPPPMAQDLAVRNFEPYERQLNNGYYVDGTFVAAPSSPNSSALTPTQAFGMPLGKLISFHWELLLMYLIDPLDLGPVVSPPTPGQKRTVEGSEPTPKRQKKETSTVPPRRSMRLLNTQVDEEEKTLEGGGKRKVVLKFRK